MNDNNKNELPIEILAPWSNLVVKSRMTDEVFEDLSKMYDEVMKSKWESHGQQLVGQVDEEPFIKEEFIKKHPKWVNFCVTMIQKFIASQQNTNQISQTTDTKLVDANKFKAEINAMWFVNQKPTEYNPAHVHTQCSISAIAYLRTPKNQIQSKKMFYDTDGKLCFINNTGSDSRWSVPILNIEPKEKDFYIFPALQTHLVYPYKSTNPEDLRDSISFNANVENM